MAASFSSNDVLEETIKQYCEWNGDFESLVNKNSKGSASCSQKSSTKTPRKENIESNSNKRKGSFDAQTPSKKTKLKQGTDSVPEKKNSVSDKATNKMRKRKFSSHEIIQISDDDVEDDGHDVIRDVENDEEENEEHGESVNEYHVEDITSRRWNIEKQQFEYLTKWTGHEKKTWELRKNFEDDNGVVNDLVQQYDEMHVPKKKKRLTPQEITIIKKELEKGNRSF
jgi:hypothetical protein